MKRRERERESQHAILPSRFVASPLSPPERKESNQPPQRRTGMDRGGENVCTMQPTLLLYEKLPSETGRVVFVYYSPTTQ